MSNSTGFLTRKQTILVALNSDTPDKSPKGYVDEPLLPLIVLINQHADYVTTSSCSGRICTYLEGMDESLDPYSLQKQEQEKDETSVPTGYDENTSLAALEASKRAKGGQWLYVSHDPVDIPMEAEQAGGAADREWIVKTLFGPEAHRVVTMEESMAVPETTDRTRGMAQSQLVYFKFEPMILHIEARTPEAAKTFLNHSLFSGYRNSGILPSAKRTMLAIRSTLKIDAPIAYIPLSSSASASASSASASSPIHLMVSLSYLRVLLDLSNDKFRLNVAQMTRFEARLKDQLAGIVGPDGSTLSAGSGSGSEKKKGDQEGGVWEDKDARKERKRREGLERKKVMEEQARAFEAALKKAEEMAREEVKMLEVEEAQAEQEMEEMSAYQQQGFVEQGHHH